MASFIITIITSSIILYTDYHEQLESQINNLEQLKKGYSATLSHGLWHYNVDTIDLQLNGILSFPNVIYAGIKSPNQQQGLGEEASSSSSRHYEYPLFFQEVEGSPPINIGTLNIVIDQQYIYSSLLNKGLLILLTQFVKTLIVSFLILILVNKLITKHLRKMASWANELHINTPLVLERNATYKDELSKVAQAINTLRINQLQAISKIEKIQAQLISSNLELQSSNQNLATANEQLAKTNQNLEDRVSKRTHNLVEAMNKLKDTQFKLIETEKMLALGDLVAGVAHELNTPLGVCITAQSHLTDLIESVNRQVKNGLMTRTSFDKSITLIAEAMGLLDSNLSKSKSLISSFKQLGLHSQAQTTSRFSLTSLITQIEDELSYSLNEQSIELVFLYAQEIEIESFINPLKTVVEQLIRNSLEHGFPNFSGNIFISAIEGDGKLYLDYRDEGVGIPENIREVVFKPFVTTGRIKGQAGIGLNLVYNIITQILDGKITLLDSHMGTHFSIEISTKSNTPNKNNIQPLPLP